MAKIGSLNVILFRKKNVKNVVYILKFVTLFHDMEKMWYIFCLIFNFRIDIIYRQQLSFMNILILVHDASV